MLAAIGLNEALVLINCCVLTFLLKIEDHQVSVAILLDKFVTGSAQVSMLDLVLLFIDDNAICQASALALQAQTFLLLLGEVSRLILATG